MLRIPAPKSREKRNGHICSSKPPKQERFFIYIARSLPTKTYAGKIGGFASILAGLCACEDDRVAGAVTSICKLFNENGRTNKDAKKKKPFSARNKACLAQPYACAIDIIARSGSSLE